MLLDVNEVPSQLILQRPWGGNSLICHHPNPSRNNRADFWAFPLQSPAELPVQPQGRVGASSPGPGPPAIPAPAPWGWGWAGGQGEGGGKLSGLITFETLPGFLFVRDPRWSAPRALPEPSSAVSLSSSRGEGWDEPCRLPVLCPVLNSLADFVGRSSGVSSELSPRTMGWRQRRPEDFSSNPSQIPAKSQLGCWECSSPQFPLYLTRGSGQPCQQLSATSPLCPFVPLETAALSRHSQVFS